MAKFSVAQLMNDHTKAEGGNDAIAFKIEFLDINDIEPSELNKYSVDDVAELKASIELIGLQQNLVVRKRENAKYELLSGERRYTALSQLVTEGKESYARVPCKIIKSIDDIQAELQLIFANSTARRLKGHEMAWQAARLTELLRAYRDGGYKMTGKTRDIVAELLKVSPSQVHRLESIDNNLIPELKNEFQKENINTTTAFELSRLDEEKQKEALADLQGGGELTPENVKQKREKSMTARESAILAYKNRDCNGGEGKCTNAENLASFIKNGDTIGCAGCCRHCKNVKKCEKVCMLKPCPFCGHSASVNDGYNTRYIVTCGGCLVGTQSYAYIGTAIDAWNKRV